MSYGGLIQLGLSNAAMAAVLSLAAGAATAVFRRPALTRALWIVVLLKLLTPPLWVIPVPTPVPTPASAEPGLHLTEAALAARAVGPRADGASRSVAGTAGGSQAPGPEASGAAAPNPDAEGVVANVGEVAGAGAGVLSPKQGLAAAPPVPAAGGDWADAPLRVSSVFAVLAVYWPLGVAVVWAGGSVAYALAVVFGLGRLRRLMRNASPAPAEVRCRAADLTARLGLRRTPAVRLVDAAVPPMLCVLGRPSLLLPNGLWQRLDDGGRTAVLAHELAHLRRGDHWVRALELLVSVLYWWHPSVWWARRELGEATEQCCDAWVLSALPRGGGSYAAALLDAIDFISTSTARPAVPALASGMGQFTNLRRRLLMIKHRTVRRALTWPGFVAVTGLAGFLLPLSPSLGQSAAPPAPAPTTPAPERATEPVTVAPDPVSPARASAAPAPVPTTPTVGPTPTTPEATAPVEPSAVATPIAETVTGNGTAVESVFASGSAAGAAPAPARTARTGSQLDQARAEVQRLRDELNRAESRLANLEGRPGNVWTTPRAGARTGGTISSGNSTIGGGAIGAPRVPPTPAAGGNRIRSGTASTAGNNPAVGPAVAPSPGANTWEAVRPPRAAANNLVDPQQRLDLLEQQLRQMLDELRQLRQDVSRPGEPSARESRSPVGR